jgi:hypothetical protein
MEIANPMYDAVFKFLMYDPECAHILLSGLTGLDIVEVEPLPQDNSIG